MQLLEFVESMEKEMKGTEEAGEKSFPQPNPYDVFLIETTLENPNQRLAVYLPLRNKQFAWYNGDPRLYRLEDLVPKWRVASLSGPARVLQALSDRSGLTMAGMKRELLFQPSLQDLNYIDEEIDPLMNDTQRLAVAAVSGQRFKSGFLAVQGPPGTGKTTTIVSMVAAILETERRLLVAAPSHAAVANVAKKLFETGLYQPDEIFVFGENSHQSVHFLNPSHRRARFGSLFEAHQLLQENNTEPEECKRKQEMLRKEFQSSFLRIETDVVPSLMDLANYCEGWDMDEESTQDLDKGLLSSASVVCCTLNAAGSNYVRRYTSPRTILLDEAGQTTEAEFFIATSFPGVQRIIAVGDPRQLPSTVISRTCHSLGFGASWLEKIEKLRPDALHLLNIQYRMDPDILAFPNQTFYKSRIQSGPNVFSREPHVEKPFLFVDTRRRGREERDNFSYHNAYEAVVIKSLLGSDEDIIDVIKARRRDQQPRVLVITPYRAQ